MRKKISSLILTAAVLMVTLFSATAYAAGVELSYVFTGDEAELAGYAEGTVTINGGTGKYTLCWGNADGALTEYEPIALINGGETYALPENMAIPASATKLIAYSGESVGQTAAAEFTIPENKRFSSGREEFTFASVSDIHVNYNSSDPNSDNYCGAPQKWTNALNYFAELGLDMVVISGDCTSVGGQSEYEVYASSINASSYPPEKIYMARGNHDSQENGNYIQYSGRDDMVRPFENSPWFYVYKQGQGTEKNNLFIFLAQELDNISNTPNQDNFSEKQMDWLENLLEEYAGTNTNIFITEHAFYHNWGPGDRYDGVYVQPMYLRDSWEGNMRLQKLLMEYKEAVFMTGHSHLAFSEMVNFSDENGTACRMIHNSSTSQLRRYNSSGSSIVYRSEGNDKDNGSEGYVVRVYQKDIVYNGTNLTSQKIIPTACYIFPSYTEDRKAAKSIAITKAPDKTEYNAGDFFDAAGMEITATYADGTTHTVRGWGLQSNLSLSGNATEVIITYGDLTVSQPVHMIGTTNSFRGKGTFERPFLIENATDFVRLTECFESAVGSDASTTFGKGLFFRQTADIDMTGITGYTGTSASGSSKYGFSGVYDGGGHTIKVDIDAGSGSDASVFPYVYGAVMNVSFEGSITAGEYAQPIRTVGKGGMILNCSARMTLTGNSSASGLARSNYGDVYAYYSSCSLKGGDLRPFSPTDNGSTYTDCYYSCVNGSGNSLTASHGTQNSDTEAMIAVLNDHSREGISAAVNQLKEYHTGYTADDICRWKISDGTPLLEPIDFDIDPYFAEEVDDLIKAIGDVTLDKKAAVTAARKAYESLTDAQKQLVEELDTLEAAEKTLAGLESSVPEKPENSGNSENPKTMENGNLLLWVAVFIISGGTILAFLMVKKFHFPKPQ